MTSVNVTEQDVLARECPRCRAPGGVPCSRIGGGTLTALKHPHRERVKVARQVAQRVSIWDGDGFEPDEDEVLDAIDYLCILPHELDALAESCKSEAWLHRELGKRDTSRSREDPERAEQNLAIARYYERRAERWAELAAKARGDDEYRQGLPS